MGNGDRLGKGAKMYTPKQLKRMFGIDKKAHVKTVTEKQANRLGLLDDKYINVRSVRGNYERITYKRIIDGVTYIFTRYEKRKGTEKRFKV